MWAKCGPIHPRQPGLTFAHASVTLGTASQAGKNRHVEDAITKALRNIVREEIEAALKRHRPVAPKKEQRERLAAPHHAPISRCTRCEHLERLERLRGYEPLWNTTDVAEFLGIARKTVLNRISLGQFPQPIKNGRLNAFRPADIVAYRQAQFDQRE